ncbi:MAG: hypothetical protein HOP37_14070 [Cyclobacteriaceae bacterium]|nr:hypothetical protein [Cyclobacteriaceae bacterium]
MKNFLFSSLLLLSIVSFGQKGPRESYQPTVPIVIDADPNEWSTEWLLDQDGKFLYNVGNDESNLYFRVKVTDDITQQKIAFFGLILKLDVNGKKKGRVGLKYPVAKDPKQLKKEQEPWPQDPTERIAAKKRILDEVEILELIGLAKDNIVSSRLGLMNGIEVLITVAADGAYLYEAKIPFKAFRIDKASVPILGVSFETGKFDLGRNPPAAPAGGQAGRNFGGSYGQYNPNAVPAYMWAAVKLN